MGEFLASLSWQDLQRLRAIVRKVHFQYVPLPFDVREADKLIEALGPEVRERLLKRAVEEKLG